MGPAVPDRLRRERAREIGRLSEELARAYEGRWVGRECEVLLEAARARRGRAGAARGVSENYLKVDVLGVPDGQAAPGRIARVRISAAGAIMSGSFLEFQP